MKEIRLTKGYVTIVDDEDFDKVSLHKWQISFNVDGGLRARGAIGRDPVTHKQIQVLLHRFILGVEDRRVEIDHINGNGLDNRRCNLRLATRSQNLANRKVFSNNRSGYKGVKFDKRIGKYRLTISMPFDTAEEAARTYDKIAVFVFGEFAKTNFPSS